MLLDPLRVRIRIPDSLADGLGGFLRSARLSPGRWCELPGRFLLRHARFSFSVGRCAPMPLANCFFCDPVPVRLSVHGNLRLGPLSEMKHRLRSRIPPLRWSRGRVREPGCGIKTIVFPPAHARDMQWTCTGTSLSPEPVGVPLPPF